MPRDRDLLIGTLAAVVAAVLFGTLGPLSRFGAEAGVGGVAFTAWRAILGVAFLVILVTARGAARSSVAAVRALPRRGRAALATAAIMGVTLNVSMFTAFGLVPIALALMLFYLYPAGVVVVDLALGHERMTRSRLVALAFSFERRGARPVRRGHDGGRRAAQPARDRAVHRGGRQPGRVHDREPGRVLATCPPTPRRS